MSKALDHDLDLLRAIGLKILNISITNRGALEKLKLIATSFSKDEIMLLAKLKAELDAIAPPELTKKEGYTHLWNRYLDIAFSSSPIPTAPVR